MPKVDPVDTLEETAERRHRRRVKVGKRTTLIQKIHRQLVSKNFNFCQLIAILIASYLAYQLTVYLATRPPPPPPTDLSMVTSRPTHKV